MRNSSLQCAWTSARVLLLTAFVMGVLAFTGASPIGKRPIEVTLAPVLGNYPDTSIVSSSNTVVTPDTAPTNATRMNVQVRLTSKASWKAIRRRV